MAKKLSKKLHREKVELNSAQEPTEGSEEQRQLSADEV